MDIKPPKRLANVKAYYNPQVDHNVRVVLGRPRHTRMARTLNPYNSRRLRFSKPRNSDNIALLRCEEDQELEPSGGLTTILINLFTIMIVLLLLTLLAMRVYTLLETYY